MIAEMGTLSRISCVRLKLITRQVINELSGGALDTEKVAKLAPMLSWSDIRATLAAIAFVLRGAVRFDVDAEKLNTELQQLGLPKENSDGVSRPYRIHRERLRAQARVNTLSAPRVVSLDWRVDAAVASSSLGVLRRSGGDFGGALGEPAVTLRFGLSHASNGRQPRYAAADAGATPLRLGAHAAAALASAREAAARSPGGVAAAASTMGSAVDAAASDVALLALGVRPLGAAEVSSETASPRVALATAQPLASPGASATPLVTAADSVSIALTSTELAALIAELKIAAQVLDRVA